MYKVNYMLLLIQFYVLPGIILRNHSEYVQHITLAKPVRQAVVTAKVTYVH
jgi:hypothetical protein